MGRHVADRTASDRTVSDRAAGFGSLVGLPQRASESIEPRGRLFGRRAAVSPEPIAIDSMLSVTQTMLILERIAERRTHAVGVTLGLVDRIQTLP